MIRAVYIAERNDTMNQFHELIYQRPDMEQFRQDLTNATRTLREATSFCEADSALLAMDALESRLDTMATLANIRHNMNTADPFYEAEVIYLNDEIASCAALSQDAAKAITESPFRAELEEKYGTQYIRTQEASILLQSEAVVPELQEENELVMRYSKLTAEQSCDFQGENCNFYGLLKHMESTDRTVRKQAFEAWAAMYARIADELDEIYDTLIANRLRQAEKLGFTDYISQAYLSLNRFDYGPDDVASFRKQVRDIITPLCAKLRAKQAERLGVDKLEYYDENLVFPDGNCDPLGGREVLVPAASIMYHDLSDITGQFFDFLTEHELFDLETRPNKHMGGYCTSLPEYKAPFIFSNFNGTFTDVNVLTHEAGHCLNAYLSMRNNPLCTTVFPSTEACEIHSMSMELFALPYMKHFVGEENAEKARITQLSDALLCIPYLVSVDEFQHGVFANPTMSAKERRALWHSIEQTYMPWRSYDGNEFLEEGGFWMQKQHIFMYPFYYIDYALAQLSAFEFYGRNKANHEEAWADYIALCKAGGTLSYPNLLKLAHLSSPFEEGTVEKILGYVVLELM